MYYVDCDLKKYTANKLEVVRILQQIFPLFMRC